MAVLNKGRNEESIELMPTAQSSGMNRQPPPGDNKNPAQRVMPQKRRKWIVLALLLLSFLLFSGAQWKRTAVISMWLALPSYTVHHAKLWVLVPQTERAVMGGVDIDLCRTVLSAAVLSYTNPITIPYSEDQANSRAKGIVDFLEDQVAQDDMIIITEDTYFQLPSEVLLQRYYDQIKQANKNGKSSVWQAVLMGSVAGHPSHSFIMGPAWALHRAYAYAVLNNIDLVAEYARQSDSRVRRSLFGRAQDESATLTDLTNANPPPATYAELGVTLDTSGSLVNSAGALHRATPRKKADYLRAPPPFWTVGGMGPVGLPNDDWSTVEVLATDDKQRTVPATLGYARQTGGADANMDTWASLWFAPHLRTLLTMANYRPNTALAAVLDASGDTTVERRFWNPEVTHSGIRVYGARRFGDGDESATSWLKLCAGEAPAQAIFGDGKGEWVVPPL